MSFPVVALMNNNDLFFVSRVQETARQLGIPIVVSPPRHGLEICEVERPRLVILDLQAPDAIQTAREIAGSRTGGVPRIVGYYPHVNTALRDEAVAAGVDEVLPQSAFTARLSRLLTDAGGA